MENNSDIAALESIASAGNYNDYVTDLIVSQIDKKYNIVDFGAGFGLFTERIKNLGFNISAVEINNVAIKKLKNKDIDSFHSLGEVPTPIDCIVSLNVLEHIEDDNSIIKEFYKKLPSNGKLILYLPASSLVWTKLDVLVNHKRRYSKSEVKKLLTSNQFKIEKIIYVDFIGWIVLLLSKIFKLRLDFDSKKIKIYDRYIFKSFKFFDFITKNIIGKNLFISATKK